jgi:hypothetical protein
MSDISIEINEPKESKREAVYRELGHEVEIMRIGPNDARVCANCNATLTSHCLTYWGSEGYVYYCANRVECRERTRKLEEEQEQRLAMFKLIQDQDFEELVVVE